MLLASQSFTNTSNTDFNPDSFIAHDSSSVDTNFHSSVEKNISLTRSRRMSSILLRKYMLYTYTRNFLLVTNSWGIDRRNSDIFGASNLYVPESTLATFTASSHEAYFFPRIHFIYGARISSLYVPLPSPARNANLTDSLESGTVTTSGNMESLVSFPERCISKASATFGFP